MRIKRDSLDILFSQFIRLRANEKCQRCLSLVGYSRLAAAHCWGRRKKSVRWDEDNALALCFRCHQIIDSEDPEAKRILFTKHLGGKGYEKLNQRANWPQQYKPDPKILTVYYERKIHALSNEYGS